MRKLCITVILFVMFGVIASYCLGEDWGGERLLQIDKQIKQLEEERYNLLKSGEENQIMRGGYFGYKGDGEFDYGMFTNSVKGETFTRVPVHYVRKKDAYWVERPYSWISCDIWVNRDYWWQLSRRTRAKFKKWEEE